MRGSRGRRIAALVVAGTVGIGAVIAVANAESSLDVAVQNRKELAKKIDDLHALRHDRRISIHQQIKAAERRIDSLVANGTSDHHERFKLAREGDLKNISQLRARERALIRSLRAKVESLRQQREEISAWIEALPLQMCPVDGPHEVVDGFGDIRDMPGTPRHIHQGNDIMAATGTPIVAPFAGEAVMEPNDLGGQAVKVYGDAGYVYNAHLSAYGKLGAVEAGDVIGYVGSTGNATAPHDHFEWHPNDGPAVDPYEILMTVC
jgi:murein DD-endopeptidase MepM/ murein hydrolase activator NlpD